jgi:hypothetical protein
VNSIVGPAYGGLGSLRDSLMAGDITGGMTSNYKTGLDALREDHARGENMPSSLLDQSFRGFKDLAGQGYAQTQGGMNQYYATQNDPRNRSDYSGILGQLASGYRDAGGNIHSAQNDMNRNFGSGVGVLRDLGTQMGTGYADANKNIGSVMDKLGSGYTAGNSALSDLWDKSLGNMELFQSPAEMASKQRAADQLKRQYAQEDADAASRAASATRGRLLQQYSPDQLKAWGLG